MPRKSLVWSVALVAVLAMVATACGGGGSSSGGNGSSTSGPLKPGGTLRIAMQSDVQEAFDPQKEYYGVAWEFFRCCLTRTLMSYNGKTTAEGGAEVRPDLAASPPEVSADGLTWTFHLKQGIRYAPPLQDVTVTAQDFIRALEREADPDTNTGGYSFYYSAIKGFDDYASGKADTISGLSAPDDNTLVIQVTSPTGDLPFRLAMPASAPIPPNPDDPKARYGVAEGHDDSYGRFLVATGPYMFEGSDQLDFSKPAEQQDPVSGYRVGRSIVLVRNPSYDPSTDDLRAALPDRIEAQVGGTSNDLALKVDSGEIDFVLDGVPPAPQVQRYATDPELKDQIHSDPSDAVRYIEMNLANPPFDDIHVRRALNYAIDKAGLLQLRGGPIFGETAGHIIVDGLEDNLLKDYDPFATPNSQGDLDAAKKEMAQSKYDTNGDGVCDDPVCKDVLTLTDESDPYPKQTALIQQNLEPLGITLDVKSFERTTMYSKCEDPNSHWQLCPSVSWGKDYADAYTFGPPLFSASAIGPQSCCNDPMVGASPETLKSLGYSVTEVPSAEDQIDTCIPLTGDQRVKCWADLDKYLMENVVPWVPFIFDNDVVITSTRVIHYDFDQFAGLPALDRLALTS
jgi:peptide/nickel transport system substrate-binding protein